MGRGDADGEERGLSSQTKCNAGLFVDGLLGDERRKTGWMRAEAAGDPGPWRQQAVLGRDRLDADALRDLVRDYATEHLADENAVLVIDETGFLKQGKASCAVARQYTGSAGKITNCQIGVFAAYVSRHGHAFIDRALYLPKGWTDDPARLKATYVAGDIGFFCPVSRHRQSVRPGNAGHRHHRQSHAQKMPGLQDSFSGNLQRAWHKDVQIRFT
jgi:SRSO17 transposase